MEREKKDEKRIITEEMRTWEPTNLQDPDLESDSLWYSSVAVLGPDLESDSMRGLILMTCAQRRRLPLTWTSSAPVTRVK